MSEMNEGGTVFGDGIEADRLELPFGQTVELALRRTDRCGWPRNTRGNHERERSLSVARDVAARRARCRSSRSSRRPCRQATCDALVARIEAESPALAPINVAGGAVVNTRVRNNERVMFDDAALGAEAVRGHARVPAARARRGTLVGYNERFRGYRYRPGPALRAALRRRLFPPVAERGREGSAIRRSSI